jgi:hypothetical protein
VQGARCSPCLNKAGFLFEFIVKYKEAIIKIFIGEADV